MQKDGKLTWPEAFQNVCYKLIDEAYPVGIAVFLCILALNM
ncbi:hypothetical protein [Aliivibrio fischeri]|nr:hypothetical protein [Aliivibrio fischeri]